MSATWPAAVEAFERRVIADGLRQSTIDGYLLHLRWCAAAVGGDPWRANLGELTDWIDGRNWSAATRRSVVMTLRRFYAFGVAEGLCRWSPVAGLGVGEGLRRGPERNPIPAPWAVDVTDYLAWLRAGGRRPSSIRLRRNWLVRLAESAPGPWTVTADQLAEWIARPDLSPETRKSMRATVRGFYQWGLRGGRIDHNPSADLGTIRVPRGLPKPIPDDSIRAAVVQCDDRSRIAVLLGALAGLRRSEIAQVHLGMDVVGASLLVRGKGGHERVVPLHTELVEELRAESERRRDGRAGSGFSGRHGHTVAEPDGWLFPSSVEGAHLTPGHIAKLIGDLLPPGWSTHQLRHRFGTRAYAAERDLLATQQLMGHADPRTTARYAAASQESLQRAVALAGLAI